MYSYDRRLAASPSTFWVEIFAHSVKRDPANLERAKKDVSSWSDPSEDDWAVSVLGGFFELSREVAKDAAGAVSEAARRSMVQADFFEDGWAVYENGRFEAKLVGPIDDEAVTEHDLYKVMKSLGLANLKVQATGKSDEVVYQVGFEFPSHLLYAVAKRVVS